MSAVFTESSQKCIIFIFCASRVPATSHGLCLSQTTFN
ncbi:hypothetical protein Mpsy_0098 [Methanolobus psychrophilus R15]|nr:hypothetical protein Mpsy_0098 [Methanolobus psychrophilus R15]